MGHIAWSRKDHVDVMRGDACSAELCLMGVWLCWDWLSSSRGTFRDFFFKAMCLDINFVV